MKTQGPRAVATAVIVALLLLAGAWVANTAEGGSAAGQGISFDLEPERPTEADEIVVVALVRDDWCYSIDGVELGVSADAVTVRIVADAGQLCPAIAGPFETRLPVPIGRLAAGTYPIEVSFAVCADKVCEEIGLESTFDVVAVGDANCDGSVNSIDANVVLQESARLASAPCLQGADANRDGVVQSIDATLILQYDAGLVGQLPPG